MIYMKSIDKIVWEDIKEFCQQRRAEDSYLDYKREFPKHLEKTIAAMGNTLGGIILIGVDEDSENKPKIPICGIIFQRGLSERVMNIILSNISPPFFPEIKVSKSPDGKRAVVLVRVPQSHMAPHAITKNTEVYLRTGNRNKPEALAKIDEIEWLKDLRKKSEDLRETLYGMADSRFSVLCNNEFDYSGMRPHESRKIEKGWLILSLCPVYPKEMLLDPPGLEKLKREIVVNDRYSGGKFPHIEDIHGQIVQDGVVFKDYTYPRVFHTQLNSYGLLYYRQDLLHDYRHKGEGAKNTIYGKEILWRIEQFLNFGTNYYSLLGYMGPLKFHMKLDEVQGCVLKHPFVNENFDDLHYSIDNSIHFSEMILADLIQDNKLDLIANVGQRICWAFGLVIPKMQDSLETLFGYKE